MKEKLQILSSFLLKIIAMSFMLLDHIGQIMIDYYGISGTPLDPTHPLNHSQSMVGYIFKLIGRIALPLFMLLLADGMRHSKNRTKYIARLGSIQLIIIIADIILDLINRFGKGFYFSPQQSAFSDLLGCALFIYFIEKKGWKKVFAALPVAYFILSYLIDMPVIADGFDGLLEYTPYYLYSDYSIYGFLIFLGFYYSPKLAKLFSDSIGKNTNAPLNQRQVQAFVNASRVTVLIIVNVAFWAIYRLAGHIYDPYLMQLQTYAMMAVLPIFMHNGKKGYDAKWWRYFEYIFYPAHLALIGIIFAIIFM